MTHFIGLTSDELCGSVADGERPEDHPLLLGVPPKLAVAGVAAAVVLRFASILNINRVIVTILNNYASLELCVVVFHTIYEA